REDRRTGEGPPERRTCGRRGISRWQYRQLEIPDGVARGVERGNRRPPRPDTEDEQAGRAGRPHFRNLRVGDEDVCGRRAELQNLTHAGVNCEGAVALCRARLTAVSGPS